MDKDTFKTKIKKAKDEEADEWDIADHTVGNDWRKLDYCWRNIYLFLIGHIGSVYAVYLMFTEAKLQTCVFAYFLYLATAISVTAGAHRLWSHKSYKVNLPLKVILLVFYTMAHQGSVYAWVRDHRVHHKHTDTDADPHNASRGFLFAQIGWVHYRKHPMVTAKGKTIDMSDIRNDPLLRFQHKYHYHLVILLCYGLPTYIPTLWGETAWRSLVIAGVFRHMFTVHMISLINSAAHLWGNKPYDKSIRPSENMLVSFVATGEGFHNYHHTFPWDYKAAELGGYSLNLTKLFIDAMASIGWAYDLKTVSQELLERRVKNTGDGSHPVWGWDDKELSLEDRKSAIIIN